MTQATSSTRTPLRDLHPTTRAVATYFAGHETLTVREAVQRLSLHSLGQEVYRLRRAGYSIATECREVERAAGDRTRIAVYRMSAACREWVAREATV